MTLNSFTKLYVFLNGKQKKQFSHWLSLKEASTYLMSVYTYFRENEANLNYENWLHKTTLEKGYKETSFRKAISDLNLLLRSFFSYIYVTENEDLEAHLGLRQLAKHLPPAIIKKEIDTNNNLINNPLLNYYNKILEIENVNSPLRLFNHDSIDYAHTYLNQFNTLENLYLMGIKYSHMMLYGMFQVENTDSDYLLILKKNSLKESSDIVLLLVLALLNTLELESSFSDFLNLLLKLKQNSNEHNKYIEQALILGLNVAINQGNKGNVSFRKDALELYKIGLKTNSFEKKNILDSVTYRNAITLAIQLKDFTWAEDAIESYKNKLEKANQQTYYNFCKSKLHFEQQDFKTALKHLQNIDYKDIFITLNTKSLQIKCYYELGYFNELEFLNTTFKSYIKRNITGQNYKSFFLNFSNFITKLLTVKDLKKIKQYKIELISTQMVASKNWLEEQFSKLEKQH